MTDETTGGGEQQRRPRSRGPKWEAGMAAWRQRRANERLVREEVERVLRADPAVAEIDRRLKAEGGRLTKARKSLARSKKRLRHLWLEMQETQEQLDHLHFERCQADLGIAELEGGRRVKEMLVIPQVRLRLGIPDPSTEE